MNIIYHRNCLDGTFSSLLLYLLSRIIDEHELANFKAQLLALRQQTTSNITHILTQQHTHITNQQNTTKYTRSAVNQDFFHQQRGVPISTYSIFAGDYYPLKFPNKASILFILDTTLVSAENIAQICRTHELVVLIDHHTSFKDLQQKVDCLQIKNFVYIFDQNYCASKLTLEFIDKFFRFRSRFQQPFLKDLEEEVGYVSANDLKKNESKQSKSFVLGFYYFDLQLSHLNPNLYKRVGLMDLSYVLAKGKNLYKEHLKEIQEEVSRTKVCQFNMNGFFKNQKCLYLQPRNATKISDIGTIIAFLSADSGLLNLAVMALKKDYQLRISCRSHRIKPNPVALQLAKIFNGGGHKQAAGFKLSMNDFRGRFKILSAATVSTKFDLSLDQIQQIFFGQSQEQQDSMQIKAEMNE